MSRDLLFDKSYTFHICSRCKRKIKTGKEIFYRGSYYGTQCYAYISGNKKDPKSGHFLEGQDSFLEGQDSFLGEIDEAQSFSR